MWCNQNWSKNVFYQGRPSLLGNKGSKKSKDTEYREMCRGCGAVTSIKFFKSSCCWVAVLCPFLFWSLVLNCPQQQCDIFNTAGIQPQDIRCHQFSCPLSTHCACSVHPCHKSQTSLLLCSLAVKIYQFTWPDMQTYTLAAVCIRRKYPSPHVRSSTAYKTRGFFKRCIILQLKAWIRNPKVFFFLLWCRRFRERFRDFFFKWV